MKRHFTRNHLFADIGIQKKNMPEANQSTKYPRYTKISGNKWLKRIKSIEETACECLPHDEAPCSEASSCENYHSFYECNPKLCGAVDMCLTYQPEIHQKSEPKSKQ